MPSLQNRRSLHQSTPIQARRVWKTERIADHYCFIIPRTKRVNHFGLVCFLLKQDKMWKIQLLWNSERLNWTHLIKRFHHFGNIHCIFHIVLTSKAFHRYPLRVRDNKRARRRMLIQRITLSGWFTFVIVATTRGLHLFWTGLLFFYITKTQL